MAFKIDVCEFNKYFDFAYMSEDFKVIFEFDKEKSVSIKYIFFEHVYYLNIFTL